jgi:hypothetical protein
MKLMKTNKDEYLIEVSEEQPIMAWDIMNNFSLSTTTKTAFYLHSVASFSNNSFIDSAL